MSRDAWFPGRVIGGVALLAGPVLWLAGLFLRYLALYHGPFTAGQLHGFLGQWFEPASQLAAYAAEPGLVTAGYALFLAGALVLCPAVITVARAVATRSPALAYLGGTGMLLGLFARLYFAGVEQTAFRLTDVLGPDRAAAFILHSYELISYGPWRLPVIAAGCAYIGALLLGVGAFRAGEFGIARTLLFLYSQTIFMGVLKISRAYEVGAAIALCAVLVPLGVQVICAKLPAHADPARASRLSVW